MGYHTNFNGSIKLDRPLDKSLADYIRAFADSRRVAIDPSKVNDLDEPERIAAGLPVGIEGEFCVNIQNDENHPAITKYNYQPCTQPGLWCDWTISEDNKYIIWTGGEKFYDYVKWMDYVIKNFIVPFGYVANGEIEWDGEEKDDFGIVGVDNNRVYSRIGFHDYGERDYDV